MNHRPALLLAVALALPLAGCGGAAPGAAPTPPLQGARIGGPFALTDQHGRAVTDRDFAGRYRIMYFGYTFCPDVCPTDAQHIGAALRLLGAGNPKLAARIVPVFVTVDPARDTPAVLGQFVAAFHPRMVGLTGSAAQIAAVAKAYGVFYQADAPAAGGGYTVTHSPSGFLMDPAGRPLALLPVEQEPAKIVAEVERWAK